MEMMVQLAQSKSTWNMKVPISYHDYQQLNNGCSNQSNETMQRGFGTEKGIEGTGTHYSFELHPNRFPSEVSTPTSGATC